jgi:hypothetical protein
VRAEEVGGSPKVPVDEAPMMRAELAVAAAVVLVLNAGASVGQPGLCYWASGVAFRIAATTSRTA